MREINKYRYIFAAVLTVIVFTLGILFSGFLDDKRYSSLENQIQQNNVELESQQLQLNYLRSENVESCSALKAGIQSIISDYNGRLKNLQSFQDNSVLKEGQFENIKKSYILSGIRYWVFAEEIRKKCDYRSNTVLFFTDRLQASNGCEDCGRMGEELSLLKKKYRKDLLVFTIPTKMEDGMIEMLESQYNVSGIPTVIINGNRSKKIEGYQPRSEVEKELDLE